MKIAFVYSLKEQRNEYLTGRRLAEQHKVHWQLKWWDGPKDISHDGVYLHGVGEWDSLMAGGVLGRACILGGRFSLV